MSSIIRKVSVTATALLLSITVSTGCANSANNVSNSYYDKTEIATESKTDSIITSDDKKDDISDILVNNANPPLTATSFVEMEGTGIPQSYEELQDFIRPYPSVNYLGFEIIKRYSAEEAFEITNDDIFLYGATLYDIHVTYDYINEQPLDIYTKLSSAGTSEEQFEGYPPYLEGDKFACFLPRFDPSVINYEFAELMFAIDDEVKTPIGYHIGFDEINFVDQEGICIADDNFTASSVITSTSNNPVTYTDMIPMDDLTDFLKEDWTKRGYELNNSFLTVEDINEAAIFTGALGETLHTDDAISVDDHTYRFEGWTYLGLSDGVAWNTIDQGDGINESDFPTQTIELFKAEEGYTVGNLTLDKAAVEFNSGFSGTGIGVINAEFSGRLALEGYFYTFPADDDYQEKGDIFFLVCDGEWSGLPYVDISNGCSHWWTDDFHWIANAPILRLGNIEDYDFDLSFIKADGDVVHASVVLDGLGLDTGVNAGGLFYRSVIVESEPI